MRSLLTPLMGVALVFSSTAVAAQPPEDSKSVAESMAKIQAKAHKLDANGDGWLSEEETSKGKQSLGQLLMGN